MRTGRVVAGLAAAVTAVGAALLGTAVLATQGLLFPGFVSETGVYGQAHVSGFRWGIYAIGLGLVLLGTALGVRRVLLPAGLLAASGLLAGVAGSVSCTTLCPLPPYADPATQDLVHGVASTVGVGLTGLAILVLALRREPGPLRRLSRVFLWPIVPLGLAVSFALAFLGRGWTIGISERSVLAFILLWTVLAGLVLTARDVDRVPTV